MTVVRGQLELTAKQLNFYVDRVSLVEELAREMASVTPDEHFSDHQWALSDLREIHPRRYMLRNSAVEIFLADRRNYMFNFALADRQLLVSRLVSLRPSGVKLFAHMTPAQILRKSNITQMWQRREISNFDYLMHLNTIAGRTYNDLTQYPVFPWILTDYESETLDLTDPRVFRDLSRPIGALEPDRLARFIDRYETFDDPLGQIKKFHYGTHYSTSGAVLYYLLRLEPFTTLHIALHGGRFDHADRQFHSLPDTWRNCLTCTSDVKELIPEFFFIAEFLRNAGGFDFGVKQNQTRVNDVVLPRWASTPEEFVLRHRQALESEYVSAHLHQWIDLIFGYKQTGAEAHAAHNVFYYLTYEGAVDVDAIESPLERRAIEAQINNFGQTPCQLFRKPHPPRGSAAEYPRRTLFHDVVRPNEIDYGVTQIRSYYVQVRSKALCFLAAAGRPGLALHATPGHSVGTSSVGGGGFLSSAAGVLAGTGGSAVGSTDGDRVLTLDQDRGLTLHRWFAPATDDNARVPFSFEVDPQQDTRKRPGAPFAQGVLPSPKLFALSLDGKVLFSCGHWDNTFKLTAVDSGKVVQSVAAHADLVTCLALSDEGRVLATGSRDGTVCVWLLTDANDGGPYPRIRSPHRPLTVIYAQDEEVISMALQVQLDVLVTASKGGICKIHSIRRGLHLHTILRASDLSEPIAGARTLVELNHDGQILVYYEAESEGSAGTPMGAQLRLFDINGRALKSFALGTSRIEHMIFSRDCETVILAGRRGGVTILSALR